MVWTDARVAIVVITAFGVGFGVNQAAFGGREPYIVKSNCGGGKLPVSEVVEDAVVVDGVVVGRYARHAEFFSREFDVKGRVGVAKMENESCGKTRTMEESSFKRIHDSTLAVSSTCISVHPTNRVGLDSFPGDDVNAWASAQSPEVTFKKVWTNKIGESEVGMAKFVLREDVGQRVYLDRLHKKEMRGLCVNEGVTAMLVTTVSGIMMSNLNHFFNRLGSLAFLDSIHNYGAVFWQISDADAELFSSSTMGILRSVPKLMKATLPNLIPIFTDRIKTESNTCFSSVHIGTPRFAYSTPLHTRLKNFFSITRPELFPSLPDNTIPIETMSKPDAMVADFTEDPMTIPRETTRVVIIERLQRRAFFEKGLGVIKDAFAGCNISVVILEEMSMEEQAAAMYGANIVVGASGAAMSWAVMMRPGSVVVEISPFIMCGARRNGINLPENRYKLSGGVVRMSSLNHVATVQESTHITDKKLTNVNAPETRVYPSRMAQLARLSLALLADPVSNLNRVMVLPPEDVQEGEVVVNRQCTTT